MTNKIDSLDLKADSLNLQEEQKTRLSTTDSLKQELNIIVDDSLKAPIYTQIAFEYSKYDTIGNKKQRHVYQNLAISNTMFAIHYYSRYDDTTGLRVSFDMLAKVYHAQHKYTQAKWFILQSNTLSRAKNDNPNIIASLIELSSIKSDIKDYNLAIRDLNEALAISSKNHYSKQESQVQLHYALLYNVMKNYTKATIALKRHNAIDDSIKKDEEARMMAKVNMKDSLQFMKKKLYTINNKKSYKINSSKRIASL
jgi:tetratricopeptide (TPR) repeat protein